MNSYKCSDGTRVPKSIIDRKVRFAKQTKLRQFFDEHGYYFCEECKVSTGTYIDCSHDISVDQCQKQGRTELAWDVNNITLRCRECHVKHD